MKTDGMNKCKYELKSRLEKVLTFDVFDKINHSCFSSLEKYLQIFNKIKDYLDLFFESYIFEDNIVVNEFLTLNEVKKMLNYHDTRSARNWCMSNDVFVIQQGNSKLVSRVQFLLAFQKPFIEHIKRTHSDWKQRLSDYMNTNFKGLLDSQDCGLKEQIQQTSNYKPKSESEKSFLKNMKEL